MAFDLSSLIFNTPHTQGSFGQKMKFYTTKNILDSTLYQNIFRMSNKSQN